MNLKYWIGQVKYGLHNFHIVVIIIMKYCNSNTFKDLLLFGWLGD